MKSDREEGYRQSQSENTVASNFLWLPRAALDSIDSQIALIDRVFCADMTLCVRSTIRIYPFRPLPCL